MIITITNQKGGTGKSTLAALLVRTLAGEGRDVLALDCDPQGALSVLLGVNGKPGLFDALLGDTVKPQDAGGVRILGADHRLDKIAYTLPPYELETLLKKHPAAFVVIDTPPTVQGISRAAAIAADLILVPADISRTAQGATLYTLAALKDIKKKGRVLFIGKEPREDAHGYQAQQYQAFRHAIGRAYAGIIPRSTTAQKAAAGLVKVPASIQAIIRGLL